MGLGLGDTEYAFGWRFRYKRLRANLSLRKLAKLVGETSNGANISKMENGLRPPPNTSKKLKALCAPLNLTGEEYETLEFWALEDLKMHLRKRFMK